MKAMGGNAPIMALRFAKEGIGEVLLGAQMSSSLKKQLPSDIVVSGPILNSDDIHLLIEYPTGETWGQYVAPRANRFIVHNDHQNPLISSLEIFHEQTLKFKPDLLVISGLQMMDNFPSPIEIRKARIEKLSQSLVELRKSNSKLKIHFEMASFTDESLIHVIIANIFPNIDSIGMNEQETTNLYNLFVYGNISFVSDAYPRVALVLDQMRLLYDLLYSYSNGRLSRIHVHTLAFQTILTRKDSFWKASSASAAKAALTAHRHTVLMPLTISFSLKMIYFYVISADQKLSIQKKRD
jgi:ADP-dependent glucokinase